MNAVLARSVGRDEEVRDEAGWVAAAPAWRGLVRIIEDRGSWSRSGLARRLWPLCGREFREGRLERRHWQTFGSDVLRR